MMRRVRSLWPPLLMVVVMLLAACTPAAPAANAPASNASATSAPASSNLDPNATLRIGIAAPPTNLDPPLGSPPDVMYTSMVYDSLTQLSADNTTVTPMLATSWTFSDDGTAMTMKLRSGVTFHDGTAFDAAAVKANIDRAKSVAGSTAAPLLSSVASVDVVDPATVKFNLVKGHGASLPAVLSTVAGEMVSPKAISGGRDLKLDPGDAGTGPYTITKYTPANGATFERATQYWGDLTTRAKTVQLGILDAQAGIGAVQAGQYDLVQIPSGALTQQVLDLAKGGAFQAFPIAVRGAHTLMLNSTISPMDNLQFRQAIAYGIDRDAIGNDLYQGNCVPSYQPLLNTHWAFSPSIDATFKYDPNKAAQLLAGSGYKSQPIKIESAPAQQATGVAIQSQLQKLGMTVEEQQVPQGSIYANFTSAESMATIVGVLAGADPSLYFSGYVIGAVNFSKGGDPAQIGKVQALVDLADDPTLPAAKRGELYQQAQYIIADQAWAVQVCNGKQVWIYAPKVSGVDTSWIGALGALPWFGNLAMKKA